MSTHDDDILDFDFFEEEEPPTWEGPERTPGPPRTGGRPPRRRMRPPGNMTPLLRLVGLIALAILVIVLLAIWVEGCSANNKHDRYANYMAQIGSIGSASASLGDRLATTLTTTGLKQEDLDAKLGGFVQLAEAQAQKARDLHPPGPLHDANDAAVEALDFRVSGLKGLQTTFRQTANEKDASAAGQRLDVPAQRFVASDVVWADRFQAVAQSVMAQEGVQGIQAPPSEFVSTQDFVSPRAFATIWRRIRGAATGGGGTTGLHGTGILYTKALPSGQQLSTSTTTTIKASVQLAFEVAVEDTGDSQEAGVKVTLTIPKSPTPIVVSKTIPIIDPGETKTVTLKIGNLVPFGSPTSVKVDVQPVPGETNTSNNSYEYPVIFSFQP